MTFLSNSRSANARPWTRNALTRQAAPRQTSPRQLVEALETRQLLANQPFAAGDTIVNVQTTFGDVWIELFDSAAPITVANFLNYVNSDRYDGTFFHRMLDSKNNGKDFVLQGGGFKLDSNNIPQAIQTFAPIKNEASKDLSNKALTVAMARTNAPDSATSQFFFNFVDNSTQLDKNNVEAGYAVFGQVVKGWDVILSIKALATLDLDGSSATLYDTVPVRDSFPGGQIDNDGLVLINDVKVVASPGWNQEANGGAITRGAGNAAGESIFVSINELGRPIVFYQAKKGDPYTVADLSIMTGSGTLTGQVSAWFDTKDGRFYAAAPSTDGLLLFTRGTNGYWTFRNLTTEITGAEPVATDLAVLQAKDGFISLIGLNSSGEVIQYAQKSLTQTNGKFEWVFRNITVRDLTPQGLVTPRFVGSLSTYVTSWNGLNVAGLDDTGDVQVVWWAPGLANWTTSNLTTVTGAPKFTGGLTTYITSYDNVNIVGVTVDGNVSTTWWLPSFGGNWVNSDLTTAFSGPKLQATSITSYVTSWDGTNITGLDANGKLVVYWWAPGLGGTWNISTLSDTVTGAIPIVGKVTGVASPFGTINLVGADAVGNVLRYFWNTTDGGTWTMNNLTSAATYFV